MSAQPTTEHTWAVGDLFTVDPALYPAQCHGVVYRVETLPVGRNGINHKGRPVAFNDETRQWDPTSGPGVKAAADAMTLVDPSTEPAPYSGGTRIVEAVEFKPLPDVGALVDVRAHGKMPAGLYVVTGYPQKTLNAVRLTLLGGDGGRYWRSVPVDWCEVIDPTRVHIDELP